MFKSLSTRFLVLTLSFMVAIELLTILPAIGLFRFDYLQSRFERAQLIALAAWNEESVINDQLEQQILNSLDAFNVVLRYQGVNFIVLSSPAIRAISSTFDLQNSNILTLIRDALVRLSRSEPQVIRVVGPPYQDTGLAIEVTLHTENMRKEIINYAMHILLFSSVLIITATGFLFVIMRAMIIRPITHFVQHMNTYNENPTDARRIIEPTSTLRELATAESSLQGMQTHLTGLLKDKQRLAQLGEAVAKISHDLRNILAAAQIFATRFETSTDQSVQKAAPKLLRSIARAINLCENTLAFGKVTEPLPVLSWFDFSGFIQDLLDNEVLKPYQEKVDFVADSPADLRVRADAEQLYRVLFNLINNACQAITQSDNKDKKGQVKITASETDQEWHIHIYDTGPGLSEMAQKNIFVPFQGGSRQGGNGLGLAIASELVRGHGGALLLVSSNAKGTHFQITLPKGMIQP